MNKKEFINSLPKYDEVFTFKNLYDAANKCKNGVYWKKGVQKYHADLNYNICCLHEKLISRKYKSKKFTEFDIIERGKSRHIMAPSYEDRIVQRCLCDNYLVPLLSRFIIYDNSATIKGRGTEFAINRLKAHLEKFSRKRKDTGYILLYDFKDYFNSIDHIVLYKQIDKLFVDEELKRITHHFIDAFGDKGLGLGSQVSQICAVYFPNKIDHYFKDQLRVKYYGRYMDDGYIICENLEEMKMYKSELIRLCNELKLDINEQKIKIVKLSHSFTFLKRKITLTEKNHIYVKLLSKSIKRMRAKLNTLDKKIGFEDVETSYKSWRGSAIKNSNYYQIKRLDQLYNEKYIEPFIKGEANELS